MAELTVRSAQSDLLEVEGLDFGPDAPATAALEAERGLRLGAHAPASRPALRLLAIDPIVPAAAQIGGMTLRSLDAIHLTTAASISRQLGALITYDQRMISEGQTIGLPVLSPA